MNWHPEGWGFWYDDNEKGSRPQSRLCTCKHSRKQHRQGPLAKNKRFKLFIIEDSKCDLCECKKYEEVVLNDPIEE